MKKKKTLVFVLGGLFAIALVSAYWMIDYQEVTYCDDSDGGLDFETKGTIIFTNMNGTNETYTDFCYSSTEVREFACSGDVPPNPSGYAGYFGENCSALNNTNICFDGACVYNATK